MSLEELLRMRVKSPTPGAGVEITPDFRMAVQEVTEAGVRVIVHPFGYAGGTLDFIVSGDTITRVS